MAMGAPLSTSFAELLIHVLQRNILNNSYSLGDRSLCWYRYIDSINFNLICIDDFRFLFNMIINLMLATLQKASSCSSLIGFV